MIPTTPRPPDKGDPEEVKKFQKRYGLKVDGVWGYQSQGQVGEIEKAHALLMAKYRQLAKKYAVLLAADKRCSFLDWLRTLFGVS